ncbi:hypothetical protein N665_0007s0009 [Sinapis alba]|nr:hypothetical protein N665_0007s0009 [Sinapis alba]
MLSTRFHLPDHVENESWTRFLQILKTRISYQAKGTSLATRSRMMVSTFVNHG